MAVLTQSNGDVTVNRLPNVKVCRRDGRGDVENTPHNPRFLQATSLFRRNNFVYALDAYTVPLL